MIHQIWRLSEASDDNLGLACTEQGLLLGRTPLIERRDGRFLVRDKSEIERLLNRAYPTKLPLDQLMEGFATVASALNANDPGLARIAAVHLRIPDLPDEAARDAMEAAGYSHQIEPIGIPRCIRAPACRRIPAGLHRLAVPAPSRHQSEQRKTTLPIKVRIPRQARAMAGSGCNLAKCVDELGDFR